MHDELDPELARAYRFELAGKLEEAAALFEAWSESHPKDTGAGPASVLKHLGNLHFRLGHLKRARTFLARACEIDPRNPAAWHDLGVVEYHRADFDASIAALGRVLELEPGHHLSEFWLGNALYHQGRLDEAIRAFERLLETIPSYTIARFHLGVLYARRGDRARAEEEFARVLEDNPQDAAARFYVSG
jgi:tetratricopeptide (TPR) repeat protein